MKICDINPFLRYAVMSRVTPLPALTCSYDSRLFYVVDGTCNLAVNGKEYRLVPRDLIIWKCGKKYCFRDYENLNVININFDFTQIKSDCTDSFSPVLAESFDASLLTEKDSFTDLTEFNDVLYFHEMDCFQESLTDIVNVFATNNLFRNAITSSQLKHILTIIAVSSVGRKNSTVTPVDAVLQYLSANYGKDISNAEIGNLFGYHPNYINRLVLKYVGVTMRQYVIQIRISKAKELLKDSDLPLGEIAEKCGFNNIHYFSGCFKKAVKMPPRAYRDKHKNLI